LPPRHYPRYCEKATLEKTPESRDMDSRTLKLSRPGRIRGGEAFRAPDTAHPLEPAEKIADQLLRPPHLKHQAGHEAEVNETV